MRKFTTKIVNAIFERPSFDYEFGFFKFLRYNLFFHLRPLIIPKHATRVWYCLGGITFLLFIVLAITGVLLAFYYVPSPDHAYDNVKAISTTVPFGWFIRRLHRLAAHGMVITVFLHMLRVYFTGAYKPPRQLNWIVGVILLILTLAFSFTGYLLPWDQLAYWAITIGTEMAKDVPIVGRPILLLLRGGEEVAAPALLRFYTLHVFILPAVVAIFIGIHLWRVRKQGISGPL